MTFEVTEFVLDVCTIGEITGLAAFNAEKESEMTFHMLDFFHSLVDFIPFITSGNY